MTTHAAPGHPEGPIEQASHGHAPADPESIRKEKNIYLAIFAALGVLTVVTVLISRVHFGSHAMNIFIALGIAAIKATLVAGFFMHLLHERKFIYGVLLLTIFFFGMLIWGPWHHHYEATGDHGDRGAIEVTSTATGTAPAAHSGH